ncbi:MAG: hypothetical protein RL318_2356 [Fibrobacterota bacterium]|jgi:prepilin-type N-terminal cleavage/methylation domain-containing protein
MSKGIGSKSAITLLELMVVIVIIGILSMLAIPKVNGFLAAQRLGADANRLYLDLQWARTLAAKTSIRHYVVLSGTSWQIFREASTPLNLAYNGEATETKLKQDSLSVGVQFGIASGVSAPASAPVAATGFSSTAVPSGGLAPGAAVDNCVDGAVSGDGTWNSQIVFCGGRGLPDVETGALYLSTSKVANRIEGILYNDVDTLGSLQIQRWTWENSTWKRK